MRLKFALAGCCVLAAGCASAAANDHHAGTPASRDEKPRVLSVDYGKVRPAGATGAYYAVSIRALDPDGQIVSWTYEVELVKSGATQAAIGDGGCGLGGRRNGRAYDSSMPINKLPAGTYRFRIKVEDSTCTGDTKSESASRTFTIHVR